MGTFAMLNIDPYHPPFIIAEMSGNHNQSLARAQNLTTKRPGTGILPMRWDEVIGRTAPRDFAPDELIEV